MELALESAGAADGPMTIDGKRPTPIVRDAHALLVRGIEALERNHLEEAAGLLRQSVELDPQSFHAQLALGVTLTKTLDIPRAELALETAIELDPRSFWAHLRMAQLYQRVGVPSRCIEELQVALDVATRSEEMKIARDLMDAEKDRNAKRAWRPDFLRLRSRNRKDER